MLSKEGTCCCSTSTQHHNWDKTFKTLRRQSGSGEGCTLRSSGRYIADAPGSRAEADSLSQAADMCCSTTVLPSAAALEQGTLSIRSGTEKQISRVCRQPVWFASNGPGGRGSACAARACF